MKFLFFIFLYLKGKPLADLIVYHDSFKKKVSINIKY